MVTIQLQANFGDVLKAMDVQRSAYPKAAADALNDAAFASRRALVREIPDSFDRPTAWIKRSPLVGGVGGGSKLANKDRLQVEVRIANDADMNANVSPADVLRADAMGGQRRLKRYEVALRRVGILPDGMVTVPGKGVELDRNGNVSGGTITALLSYFQTFDEQGRGYKLNATAATKARRAKGTRTRAGFVYFVGRPADGRLPLGIYKRTKTGTRSTISPILIFVDSARYDNQRFAFQDVVRFTAQPAFSEAFPRRLSAIINRAS